MKRLIDMELLLKDIENSRTDNPHTDGKIKLNHDYEHQHFMFLTVKQPIAFDIDKVIEQLLAKIQPNVDCETGEPCWNWVIDMNNELIGECIDIIRKGGLEE